MTDIDVLVIGGAGVDTIVYVPHLPMPYADSHLVSGITSRAGQTGDGVAVGLHALGVRTHHLDVLGDDYEGELVRTLHSRRGVPLTAAASPAGTRRAVNLVAADGRRMSFYDPRGEGPPLPEPLLTGLVAQTRHVHACITDPRVLTELRGVTISTDLHDWDGVEAYHEAYASAADVVFVSTAKLADHEATMRRILTLGRAAVVVATAGARGSFVLHRGDDAVHHVPAVTPPGPVVDSNGAGDAYVAGFLFAWLAGEEPLACARYGAIAGAHACTVPATAVEPIDAPTLRSRLE
jgi:sugar/nucleoside kinase (ribokinase family)